MDLVILVLVISMELNNLLLKKLESADVFEHPAVYSMVCKNLTKENFPELVIHKYLEDENITDSLDTIYSMLYSLGIDEKNVKKLMSTNNRVDNFENNILEVTLSATYKDGTTISVSKKTHTTEVFRNLIFTFLISLQYSMTLIDMNVLKTKEV